MRAGTKSFTFFAISLFFLPCAVTQTVTNNNNTGYPQNAIVQGTEIESVQVPNGNLHIEIPIYMSKGRGLDVAYRFILDTKGWGFTTQCGQGVCTDHPNPDPNSNVSLTVRGSTSTNLSYMGSSVSCSGVFMYSLKSNVVFTEPNGTKHHFLPDPVRSAPTLAACDGSNSTYATTLYAGDGSGWVASIGPNFTVQGPIRKDGAGGGTVDSNGNVLGGTDTLGRTLNSNGSYTDTSGALRSVTVVGTTVPVQLLPLCSFSHADQCTVLRTSIAALSSITLPNGMTYSFTYAQDGGGEPASMTLPTGGQVSWTWGGWDTGGRRVASRTVAANGVTGTWNYAYVGGGFSPPSTVTVTDPAANDTKYTCTAINQGNSNPVCFVSKVESFSGLASGNQVIKTVATDYQVYPWPNFFNIAVPIRETTTWNQTNQVRKTETDFDTFAAAGTATWENPIESREYDWGTGAAGSLVRKTHYNYLHLQNSTYRTKNIANRPTSKIVYDGQSNIVAQTTYTYDGSAVQPTSNAPGHDYTNYSSSNNIRGNLTQISRWINTTGTWLNTNNSYDDLGNLLSTTDPLSHTTSYDFTDNFTDGVNRNTRAYVTTITYPATGSVSHVERKQYFFNIGPVAASCGQNYPAGSACTNSTSMQPDFAKFTYDLMNRPLNITRGDGGQTNYSYNDTALPLSISSTQSISTGTNLANTVLLDGMGRIKQTQLTSDPQGTVYADTAYDKFGRVATVSNPYRSGVDITTTSGVTSYFYEVLSRKCLEVPPDGTLPTGGVCPSSQPANTILTTYSGNATTVTDQTGRARKSLTDGLDRMVQVFEDPTGLNYETDYRYDALGNLICAAQKGTNTGTFTNCASIPTSWRPRNFTYDSLSRLLTSANPEVGGITYSYDAISNVSTKQDARGITTTYTYDALNRLLTKTYSDGTPGLFFSYDVNPAWMNPPSTNLIGRLVEANNQYAGQSGQPAAALVNSYDPMGRIVRQWQQTPATSPGGYLTYFSYDYAGNVKALTYPSGRTVNYTFDSADRPSTAVDTANGITYATGFKTSPGGTCAANVTCYAPQGSFYALSIGQTATFNGINLTHIYNNRLQPQQFKASSTGGNAVDITYSYADPLHSNRNAGHVFSITNNLDNTRSQNFTYDQLNRITGATTASTFATSPSHCWGEAYGLDAWANLQSISPTTLPGYAGCSQEAGFSQTAGTSNRLSGFQYDVSGNTSSDGVNNNYTWNAESQLKTGGNVTYTYDAAGRRIAKSTGKNYVYGLSGEILAEANTSGTTTAEYIFFGGQRVASIAAGPTAIQNGSFETFNTLNQSGSSGLWNTGPIPNWTLSGIGGSFQPSAAAFTSLPAGPTVAYSNGGTISQTLTGIGLQPNTTYTLSVYIGHRLDGFITTYTLSLQAGSTVLQSISGSNSTIAAGTFANIVLTYTTGGTVTPGDLAVVLTSTGSQIDFDGVQLTGAVAPSFYVEDMLGTSRVVTAATGIVCYDADFYPYGGERPYVNSCSPTYKFEGKERDTETGNDDFGARYYSNRFGRWLSADWSAPPVAVPYANLTNPQTLNLYSMVADDPESFADLDGHAGDDDLSDMITHAFVSAGLTFLSDNVFGFFRPSAHSPEEHFGQALGDFAAQQSGIAEAEWGTAAAASALQTAAIPEVGPELALTQEIVGQAAMVHGATTAAIGTVNLAKDANQTSSGGPKAADAAGVTAGGQATNQHGQKLGPSSKPQVNNVRKNTREAANNAANRGSGTIEDRNSKSGQPPHFHPKRGTGKKKRDGSHYIYPQ